MEGSWRDRLVLYDEPNGDEFFVIDHSTSPPTWYKLDGSVIKIRNNVTPIPKAELLEEIRRKNWTLEALYARPPQTPDSSS
jgi:hypothetical protein